MSSGPGPILSGPGLSRPTKGSTCEVREKNEVRQQSTGSDQARGHAAIVLSITVL